VNGQPSSPLRNLATVGLAVSAPVALFSGIGVGVTLVAGPPAFLMGIFAAAISMIVVCLVALAADTVRAPREHGSGSD